MTITEFLEARIAEDEAAAQAATPGPWETMTEETMDRENIYFTVEHGREQICELSSTSKQGRDNAVHIARHAPARVLAECAAKRAIIEQHKDWPVLVDQPTPGSIEPIIGTDLGSLSIVVSKRMAWLTEREYVKRFGVEAPTTNMILALAAVYADHPDYRQEWAV